MTNLSSLYKGSLCAVASLLLSLAAALAGTGGASAVALGAGVVSALFAGGCVYFLYEARREVRRATAVCKELGMGAFDARLCNIREKGELGELLWAINDMTDRMDAFVRESSAAMEYVSHNQYFRKILEDGMNGILLNASRIINRATENVKEKMNGFTGVANDFDASLQQVVQNINHTVNNLESVSDVMDAAASGSRHQSQDAVRISNDMSTNVQIISSAAEEMSSSVQEISQQISHTSSISDRAAADSKEVEKTMEDLIQTASRINAVVQLIEEIAAQTNLLALNATIEAARAGDAGKGFAVVANEVKALANQTASATDEIRSHISNMQTATDSAARAFKGIDGVIGEIKLSAAGVAAAIEEQAAASREIAGSAVKAAEGTSNMARNISTIDQSIGQVSVSANEVKQVTNKLSSEVSADVRSLLAKMNVFMTELKKIA